MVSIRKRSVVTVALIVEDNIMFRETLKSILTARFTDIEVDEAGTGREALKKIEHRVPRFILMDIKLPDTNGLKLTKDIKTYYPKMSIIILSSYDSREYVEAASECGADFFISKNTSSPENIICTIETLIGRTLHE
jgi:DNA-binding NarL/FixJ family response regulator